MRLSQISSNLKKLERLAQQNAVNALYKPVLDELTPFVLDILNKKFGECNLHDDTGQLRKCIAESFITLYKGGLKINPGAGFPTDVYIRLNVFNVGAVYNSGVTDKRIRASIKKRGVASDGVHIVPGRGLYKMSSSESQSVVSRFNELMSSEIGAYLR